MSFSDLVKKANENKEDKEEKKKSSFSSLIEKAYSGTARTKLDGTTVSKWGTSVSDLVDRTYKYLSTDGYRKADTGLSDEIDRYMRDSGDVLQYLRANKNTIEDYDKVYQSYFDLTSALDKYSKSIKSTNELLSKFDNEEDYNNYQIGWLNPDAEVNTETVAARQEKYKTNESRIAELENSYEEANRIKGELDTLTHQLTNGYRRAGYNKQQVEEFVAKDSRVVAMTKQLEKYGGIDSIKTELEALKAENNLYNNIHRAEDDNYIPITDEVAQTASKRDYTNASMDELWEYDAIVKDYNGRHLTYDYDGNVVDAGGRVIYDADNPVVTAMRENNLDGFYDTVVEDKLGMFLSATQEDLDTAYERLQSGGNENDTWAILLTEGEVNAWKQLTPNEVTIYYYKLNTEGKASAYKFLDDMTVELTRRATQQRADEISDAPLLKQIALNVASIPMNVFGGVVGVMGDVANAIAGKEYNPYSAAHSWSNDASAIRTDTAMDIDKLTGGLSIPLLDFSVGDAYQALMSGADSLAGSFLGGTAYGILMGMGAASSEMKDLYEKGASTKQMVMGGILAGAAEMVFEKVSIDHFVKMGDVKTKKDFIINILKQGGVEASEEALTEIANTITNAMIMGSQSDWKDVGTFVKNVVNAGLGGFLSGSGMGAVGATANYAQYAQQRTEHGQTIIDEGGVDTLRQLALDMAGVTQKGDSKKLTKLAGKVESKVSAKNVGKLSEQAENTVVKLNRSDIQKALVEKGLSEKDAKRVSDYLGSTKVLTEEQIAEIEGNENIKAVYDELLDNSKSTISERGRKLVAARLGTKINAENSGELSLKNDVDVKEKVSETGKTTLADTDEEVTIDKSNPIAKVKYVDGERVVYYNTDHGTVEASNVKYASEEEGLLYEAFTDMNPAFANAVIKNYDESVPVQTYINGMREGMILYGMHNFEAVGKDIPKNTFLADLSEADQAFALKLGRAYATADAKKANKDLRSAIKKAAERAEASKGASSSEPTQNKPKKGNVSFEDGAKAETHKKHRKIISLAKHLAKAIGIDIVFYDSRMTGKKAGQGANGYFDADTDTIYLDLQNAHNDAKTIAYTLSHELVHFIKKWSPQKFNTFAEFLMEQYASHDVSAANLLKRKMVELNTTDADYAYEEMIADACETMLLDSNAVVKLMELRKSDLELFEKIKLHILKILNDIREAYKRLGYQPSSDEAKALLGMKDVLEKFYSMFEEAAVDATKNYQALGTEGYNELVAKSTENANKTVFGEASVDVGKTESGVKHQLKAHKAVGEASIAYNERHKKVHKAILQVGIESMYEMAEAMLPYLEVEGILPPDIPGKTIFKNGSYGKTGENTTLCVRTLTYEDFKDRVAEKVGRPLTVSESLLVSQKIYDIATEPQCIYCYVAADRKAYDEYLGEYWKAMDKYIKAMRKGGDSKALYTEYLAGRKDTDAQKKRWSQWESIAKSGKEYISASDLTTKRKRDGIIARKNAFSDQIKDAQRYAQSASWAKTVCDYRAYKGDILKMTSTFVDMLNSEYGLRMYSFSDYTPAFIVENMQMIIDASVKGLKSLAYTKDTDYVEIFASTGQAINVSCFAKWDAEKGTYVEDNRQGANWEKTKNLRKQYRNVGAVMVATNDAMVEWALKQDWVDVVIPYHIVKTGTTIANEYQWNNYTSESSDKSGNRAANIYPTEHNNDFATYSDLLKERGITPRFSRWYDKVASGELTEEQYMKLVNEVRLPASELSPVVPSFNLDAAKKSFGIDNEGKVIEGGFVDKGGYMGGWYRQGVDVNQEVMAVSEDIKAGKSSLDVDYGMSKAGKEKVEQRYKKQVKRIVGQSGTDYGVGVYLDSPLLTGFTDEERVGMVIERIKELGGSVFTAYDKNNNAVNVHIVEYGRRFKNKNGRKVRVYDHMLGYLKDEVKQEAVVLADELIITSVYDQDEPAAYTHDWLDNNGANNWESWKTYIQDKENTVWEATLKIANSENGEKILYEIYPIKMVEQSISLDTSTTIDVEQSGKPNTSTTDNNISQDEPIVKKNSENSQKNSNEHQQKKNSSDRILMGSLFSGGGTLEAGLVYQMLDKEFAVEYNKKIASAYTDNHGKEHMFVGDVREFDSKEKQDVFYLHASPVCKNFSPASHSGGETTLDITTAEATARVLEEQMPQVFTVENVKRYIGSEAYNIIINKLNELGYTWDVAVYKASDYGNATKRERMIIRAVKDGELPEKPQKVSNITSWGEATRDLWDTDLIPSTLVRSKIEAIKNTPQLKGVKLTKLDKPLLIYDTTKSKTVSFAWADELAPTLTTKCGDARIIMPDGKVYAPTPKFMGRIQGLPDDYKYPKAATNAFKIIGNGIPTQLTKAVMGGVLDSAYEQTHDGRILYQKKKLSNRTILANALETTAQNDIETNKLAQYKEKIALIESEEEKLAELRGKIKELSFAKGARDTAAIKKLQFEAKQTENRINTYDRQLLNLESTTALKGVLEREKQKAYQRAEQKGKEALDAYREKVAKTQRELLTRYQDQRKDLRERAKERKNKTTLRRKLRKVIKDLNHILTHGTKERNVKEEMKETVATALTLGEVLFNDNISNADIVRLGVDSVTDTERENLEKYRVWLNQLDAVEEQIAALDREERPKEERYALRTELENTKGKIKNRINYLDQKLSDVFVREKARLNNAEVSVVIEKLAADYHSLKDSKNNYISNAYSESFYLWLATLQKDLGGTKVRDMSIYQLQEVYDTFAMVLHMVRTSNGLFREGKVEDLTARVSKVQEQMYEYADDGKADPIAVVADKASKLEAFTWNELKPVFAFDKLGSEAFKELFWDAMEAEGKYAIMIDEATEFVTDLRKKYNFAKWDLDTVVKEFKLADGKIFRLTLEDMMSIYAYSKRPQAHEHMTEGGFVFDENNEYKPNVKGFRGMFKRKHAKLTTTYRVDDGILKAVEKFFNEKDNADKKAYVDAMQQYMTAMGEKGNEVSRILFGIDLFKEKVYMPLQSSEDYLNSNATALNKTPTQVSLKNIGIAKPTDPNANNPIVLRGFDEVWFEHIDKMSKYATFVIPIENLQRVFNNVAKVKGDSDISTKALIGAIYGKGAEQYIDQYITDLNGGVVGSNGYNAPLMELFGKAKKVSVSANLSVWVQQYFAIVRAMDMVRPDYFVPFLRKQDTTVDMSLYEEMRKYAPITILKEIGGMDIGSARSAKDFMDNDTRGLKGKMKVADEYLNIGATAMDKLGWITIWSAVKKEVATEQKLTPGTDEFFKACNKRFTEVIAYTQVYDSVNSRSGLMRSKSDFNKAATSFMGEPTVTVNMVDKRLHELKRAIKKKDKKAIGKAVARLGRTLSSVTVSITLSALFKSMIGANRDDEEDESWVEKWMKTFGGNLASDFNPLGMIPYLRDIVSLWEGWSIDRPDMDLIGDIVSSIKKCIKDGATLEECLALSGDLANAFGIPAKNIVRDIKGIINFGKAIFDDIRPNNVSGAFVRGFKNEERSKTDALYEAVMSGDTERAKVIEASYKGDTAYTSALRKALAENDPRIAEAVMAHYDGDFKKRASISLEIEKEGNFTQNIVRGAINNEITSLNSNVAKAIKAKENGKNAEYKKIVKELREMYPKEFIEKMLNDTILEDDEETGEDKLISLFKIEDYYSAVINGDTSNANTAFKELVAEKLEEGYLQVEAEGLIASSFSTKVKEAYMDGDITRSKAVSLLISHGEKDADEAETEIKKCDFELKHKISWSERARAYRLGKISKSALISAVMDIESESREDAEEYIRFLELEVDNPTIDITASDASSYFEYAEPVGIMVEVYLDYKEQTRGLESDKDANGKSISGSKKRKILAVIDSLPISSDQKDALYYANDWSAKTIYEAPWH